MRQDGDAPDLRPSRRRTERSTARFDWTPAQRPVCVLAQRAEALAARHVPDHERVVVRPGHDAAVRQDGDAVDLRPSRRRRAIDARFDWTPAPRIARVPAQRPEAGAARRVPHLERAVDRPGHDAAVRQDGDAPDLRLAASTCNRRFCSTGRRRRAKSVCPVSVAAQRKRPRAAMGCALASARSRWHRILRRPGRLDLIGVLWGRGEMYYILNSGAHRVSRNVGLFRFRSLLAARIQRASRGRPRRDDARLRVHVDRPTTREAPLPLVQAR